MLSQKTEHVAAILDLVRKTGQSAHPKRGQAVSDLVTAYALANHLDPVAIQAEVEAYARPAEGQRVTIVGPNLPRSLADQGTFHVHAAGCADLNRGAIREAAMDAWTIEATSKTEVCDATYDPSDFQCESGEYLYDFHFAPCVTIPEQ